ncbi:hypothetical protein FOA52_008707 [Chlamydomonas sp. UWO 241]|nr:hypothetical protein FOA52_008707 [Chlamydomonas sp. UWO 241]
MPPLPRRDLRNLLLEPSSTEETQASTSEALLRLAFNGETAAIIAAAGAIPRLVQLLGPGSYDVTKQVALQALQVLRDSNADNRAAIAAAGATANLLQEMQAQSIE